MSEFNWYWLDRGYRNHLIKRHRFFVSQAKSLLLSPFSKIGDHSTVLTEEWIGDQNVHFDTDRDDHFAILERAHDTEIEFYGLLTELHSQTRLNIIVGMFALWEKEVRDLVTSQTHHLPEEVKKALWKCPFERLFEFFECLGWDARSESFYASLDQCRLIVNTHKHGEGSSFDRLKQEFPQYIRHFDNPWAERYATHTDLQVSDEDLDRFALAIEKFWESIPGQLFSDEDLNLPDWLLK